MKIIPPLVTAAVLAFLAFFIYEWVVPRAVHAPAPEVESGAPSTLQTYRNEARGLSFSLLTGRLLKRL